MEKSVLDDIDALFDGSPADTVISNDLHDETVFLPPTQTDSSTSLAAMAAHTLGSWRNPFDGSLEDAIPMSGGRLLKAIPLSQLNYARFRGRCKELAEAACAADPTLTLVRGHYFCPVWNSDEQHWWTVREDGTVYDPSKEQFPSKGLGVYTPFSGMVICAECGTEIPEEKAMGEGSYGFCSTRCWRRCVGV